MEIQRELFDGFVRLRQCRKCRRKLHPDPHNRYRTRQVGLCFRCLPEFERSVFFSIENFLHGIKLHVSHSSTERSAE